MTPITYFMGGEITPDTLELQQSKLNKVNEYIEDYKPSNNDKCNGDCSIMVESRQQATEYTKNGDESCEFNQRFVAFLRNV
jgi:hypothetical protein